MKELCVATVMSIFFATAVQSAQLTQTFSFDASDVMMSTDGLYTRISMSTAYSPDWTPGTPDLPVVPVNILLPAGAVYRDMTITANEKQIGSDLALMPAQPPISLNDIPSFVGPDPAIYLQDALLPATSGEFAGTHLMRGRTFVSVLLQPIRINPALQKIYLATGMCVTVTYTMPRHSVVAPSLSPLFSDMLNRIVSNPEQLPRAATVFGSNQLDYVIITGNDLTDEFQVLADQRTNIFGAGRTGVVSIDIVLAQATGYDDAEKMRNYIKELVASNQTDLVVLGGDDTVIPYRGCYNAGLEVTTNLATDLYFSGLDGNWDANGNHIYGELDDHVDMAPDVIICRIPIRTEQQASDYIAKLIDYENGVYRANEGKFFLSGTKGFNNWTGDNRSSNTMFDTYTQFRQHQPVSDVEEWNRQLYLNNIQPYWSAGTLDIYFDTLTAWDGEQAGDFLQTAERFVEVYNRGWEYQYYLTHGDWNLYGIENDCDVTVDDVAQITNLTAFIATPACETAHFDGPDDPCLAEQFLRQPDSGALVYVAHSRNGAADTSPQGYGGETPDFVAKYFDALFGYATSLGEGFAVSKASFIPLCSVKGANRWTQFGLNFLGDAAFLVRASSIPHPPVLLSAVTTNSPVLGIHIAWVDNSGNETGFEIQRRSSEESSWSVLASVNADANSYVDTAIASNVFYSYRLSATNDSGASLVSNEGGLIAGILGPDVWDPTDDVLAGATALTNITADYQSHGPHTLSSADTMDWFAFHVEEGMAYWLTTYADDNVGGLFARVYSDSAATNLIAQDGDTNGLGHFAFYLTAKTDTTYYLQVEPNADRDSAAYRLYFRKDVDASGSMALNAALDTTNLIWRTSVASGDPWFAQTNETHQTVSAVRAAPVYYNETAWIETVLHGGDEARLLKFWFKTSSQENRDFFNVSFNGQPIANYSGISDWRQFSYKITGVITLRCEFARSATGIGGQNTAWMDAMSLTPVPPAILGKEVNGQVSAYAQETYQLEIKTINRVGIFFDEVFADMDPELLDAEDEEVQMEIINGVPYFTPSRPGIYYINIKGGDAGGRFSFTVRTKHGTIDDFDGDGISDVATYHPGTGGWNILGSGGGSLQKNWGFSGAIPVPADYTGNGICDMAVYIPETGSWNVLKNGETPWVIAWGWSAAIPVPGDYDGDGISDCAVYWPERGTWYILESSTKTARVQSWGWSETIPVPGDYDGDGKTDFANYWPAEGTWYIQYAKGDSACHKYGWSAALPAVGDYNGDFRTDLMLYWPAGGMWYALFANGNTGIASFGWSSAFCVPGDYSGDGRTDVTVYWPDGGAWLIRENSTHGIVNKNWGWSAASPVLPQFWINQLMKTGR